MSEYSTIRVVHDRRVATVFLHRPHRHNAWTGRMHAEFREAMAQLESDGETRAVVVTGTPPAFCVGADSKALEGHAERRGYSDGLPAVPANPGYGVRSEWDADFAWMHGYRHPIIAAVNGACAGVALALAMFSDLRFGAADAKLTAAAPKLGLPAEYGLSWIMPRVIGVTRAMDLLLSGRVFTPRETEAWGLWNGVLPDGDSTLAAAQTYAARLAASAAPSSLIVTKRQLHTDQTHSSAAESVAQAGRLLNEMMGQSDYREGLAALIERRPPTF